MGSIPVAGFKLQLEPLPILALSHYCTFTDPRFLPTKRTMLQVASNRICYRTSNLIHTLHILDRERELLLTPLGVKPSTYSKCFSYGSLLLNLLSSTDVSQSNTTTHKAWVQEYNTIRAHSLHSKFLERLLDFFF
jgi:hypothetical protein